MKTIYRIINRKIVKITYTDTNVRDVILGAAFTIKGDATRMQKHAVQIDATFKSAASVASAVENQKTDDTLSKPTPEFAARLAEIELRFKNKNIDK